MIAVATPIANHSSKPEILAKSIAIFVANAAIRVLTRLLITRIVMRNLSVLSFSQRRILALGFHFLMRASIRCLGIDMIAISLPAEKAENKINTINTMIVHELIELREYREDKK